MTKPARLIAETPDRIAGLIELRGFGIVVRRTGPACTAHGTGFAIRGAVPHGEMPKGWPIPHVRAVFRASRCRNSPCRNARRPQPCGAGLARPRGADDLGQSPSTFGPEKPCQARILLIMMRAA
jgi:hypothetical protein